MRGDDLSCDAAAKGVGKGIGEGAADGPVAGGERAEILVVGRSLLDTSVVHVLSGDAPCGTVASSFDKGGTGRLGSLHVGHVVEVDGPVANAIDEGRVMEDEGGK